MKNLITIILSFLFISYSFSDTIKYREKKLFRAYKDKVVTDVDFLGVGEYGVHYQYPTKYLGNTLKTIKCEDVYEIVDDNDNKIDYSCSEFTYSEFTYEPTNFAKIMKWGGKEAQREKTRQSKIKTAGKFIAASGFVGLLAKLDTENPPDRTDEKKMESFNNRMDIYPYMIFGLLTFGGLVLASDDKENINEEKTE